MNTLWTRYRRLARAAALMLAATIGIGLAAPAAAAPCTANCLTPGDYDLQMNVGGWLRLYKVHVPASYSGANPVALTLDLHGHALTNTDQRTRSGQLQQSDARGFIAVWPQGIANSWNGSNCCTVAQNLNIDDVGFLRAVIATLKARTNIDAAKVYVTGWSNGGGMSQRMACQAADVVSAIASIAHPLNSDTCAPSRPVTIMEFHGTADETIPYNGGGNLPRSTLGIPLGWQPARESLAAWKIIDGCSSVLTQTQLNGASRDETYRACNGGVSVGLVSVADGKHDLYTPDAAVPGRVDIAAYIWQHVFTQ